MKRVGGGFSFLEWRSPDSFEIDGVGQNEARGVVQASGREDVLDSIFGFLRDPAVDFASGGLGSGFEVGLIYIGLVIGFGDVEESRQEGMALLCPQGIGNCELNALLLFGFGELTFKFAQGGMRLALGKVENSGHLFFGVASGAGVSHCQARGDAVWGGEKDAWAGFEM